MSNPFRDDASKASGGWELSSRQEQPTRAANIGEPEETFEVWPEPGEMPGPLRPTPMPTIVPSTPEKKLVPI